MKTASSAMADGKRERNDYPPTSGLSTGRPSNEATSHKVLSDVTNSVAAPRRRRSSATDNCRASSVLSA